MTQEHLLMENRATIAPWTYLGYEEAIHRSEILSVLERAAEDDGFIADLTDDGDKALQGYHLALEEKAALLSGDIGWIEAHLGPLSERLSTWLWCRLQQEVW